MPDFQIRRRTPAERLRYVADLLDATEGANSGHDIAITAASLILAVTADELEAGQDKQPEPIVARCCVCGTTDHGGRAFYENVRGQLFCWPCADGDRPKPERTTPGGYFRCLSQYRSHVDGWVQCQLAPQHTTRHDYQNGVVACSWADGDQA